MASHASDKFSGIPGTAALLPAGFVAPSGLGAPSSAAMQALVEAAHECETQLLQCRATAHRSEALAVCVFSRFTRFICFIRFFLFFFLRATCSSQFVF